MVRNYSLSDLKFIKSSTLYSWFKQNRKFAVIDVRDDDYIGGHIKGSFHYPASEFETHLPELRQKLIKNEIRDVVFHCALSQVRGPKSTLKFLRSLNEITDRNEIEFFNELSVWVLTGGFTKWQQDYGDNKTVTEDYNKEIWQF